MQLAHHHTNTPHAYVWTISVWLPNRSQHGTELHNSVKRRPKVLLLLALARSGQLEHVWVTLKSYATNLAPSMPILCPLAKGDSQKPGRQHGERAHA